MKRATHIYLFCEILAGFGLLALFSWNESQVLLRYWPGILFLGLLSVIAESQSLAVDDNKAISIAFAIDISALLLYGLAPAAWVSFATAFFAVSDYGRGHREHLFNTPLFKSLFNAANYILSTLAGGSVFLALGGDPLFKANLSGIDANVLFIVHEAPAIFGGLITYILSNTILLALYFVFAARSQRNSFREWLQIFRWSAISMFLIGTLGVFLTIVYNAFSFLAVLLFFAPFLMFRYTYAGFTSIQKGYLDTIKAFTAALEAKDRYTIGHARRVELYCEIIANEMNLSPERTKTLKYASLLHDIGKIGIPEAILNKQDRLNEEERLEIERHPLIGAQMLENIQFLRKEVPIIREHHLYYNGQGYPVEARNGTPSMEAQILCVADSFDAMTSDRSYRRALTFGEATAELTRHAGTQFSPEVVTAFVRGLERERSGKDAHLLARLWPGQDPPLVPGADDGWQDSPLVTGADDVRKDGPKA